MQKLARQASRKLLARQELETLWETEEMQNIPCEMAGLPPEDISLSDGLDHSRLTCEEYTSYITVQVVQSMDAIAWARVNRKT